MGRLSEAERIRLLGVFDDVVPAIPDRPADEVQAELQDVRDARRQASEHRP